MRRRCVNSNLAIVIVLSFLSGVFIAKFFPYSLFILLAMFLLLLICAASRSF